MRLIELKPFARSLLWVVLITAILWSTVGCALMREMVVTYLGNPDPDTGNTGGMKLVGDAARMFSFLGSWAPAPFNVLLEGAGWVGTALAGKVAHTSVKNSPPGSVIGPVRKKTIERLEQESKLAA